MIEMIDSTIEVQFWHEESGYKRYCQFHFGGEVYRGFTPGQGFPSDLSVTTEYYPWGVIRLGDETIPYVDTSMPSLGPLKEFFHQTITKGERRVLIQIHQNRDRHDSNSKWTEIDYIQDPRWGPDTFVKKGDQIIKAFMGNLFNIEKIIDPSMYTPAGRWVDSQAEYFGRET